MPPKRLLVAWFRYGSERRLDRFVDVARALEPHGHEVGFVSLNGDPPEEGIDFPRPVMDLDRARGARWDAVMVPGACEDDDLPGLGVLHEACFGTRVQHLLDGVPGLDRDRATHAVLAPHVVIANGGPREPRVFDALPAEAQHVLAGAVDLDRFAPQPLKTIPCNPPFWSIGGFAGGRLETLLDAIDHLPPDHLVHLHGAVPAALRPRVEALREQMRIVSYGPLIGQKLAAFYRKMDVVVSAHEIAGWCDSAAEACASGVPCVVAPHGTSDFAKNMDTALVIDEASGPTIADAVRRLTADPTLLTGVARRAASRIRTYSCSRYAGRLLRIVASGRRDERSAAAAGVAERRAER